MRWLFPDLSNPAEASQVQETLAAIDRWWHEFQAKTGDLTRLFSRKSDWDLPQFMEDTLQAIEPRLMWEYGPAMRQPGHRLVITPEMERSLRPLVRTILQRAPKIEGWEFYPYRLPETVEQTIDAVKGRCKLNITGALVDASVAPGRKIDLLYSFPSLAGKSVNQRTQAAFLTTETLFGEQVLDMWVGTIGLLEEEGGSGSRPLPLDRAQATVSALIQSALDQLPQTRSLDTASEGDWSSVKLDPPEEAEDYPGRADLYVASTNNVELFQAIHGGYPFSSACHSRMGEIFCYLKLDAADVPESELVEFRARFEDTLNAALLKAQVGCCIGGGTGLRYSYVDLALTDLARGVPFVRDALAALKAPQRSWLLFHDDDLAAEWVGVYPQTPPPPSDPEE